MSSVKVVDLAVGKALKLSSEPKSRPYYVDFLSPSWRTRLKGLGRNHIFRRALGASKMPWRVADLTAGFGQDTMMALSMGCEVVAVERHPLVFQLLSEGVARALEADDSQWRERLDRLRLVHADAIQYLQGTGEKFDAIYIDPMFEKPKKSAKSPKEMQLLQGLVGETSAPEEQTLLELSLLRAGRVVVKRPLKGQLLKGPLLHSYKGQSIRYDVYPQK